MMRYSYTALALATLVVLAAGAHGQTAPRGGDPGAKVLLRGAGATFPAPLYKKWITEYTRANPGTTIDYRDVGSSEGAKRFLGQQVDFGASDSALSDEQIASAKDGASLVPTTAGMVVFAYSLPGLNGPLKLGRAAYIDLMSGRIPKWNDARIQAINPGLNLPNRDIVLVARLDGSGTTFALTNHMSVANKKWQEMGRGVGNIVGWPAGTVLVRGNEGVAARIKISEGSIGYVEFSFAKRLGLAMAHLENKAGNLVAPSAESGRAAIEANLTRIPANLRAFLPDPEGEHAYPIVSLTWLLLNERYGDPAKAVALKQFVNWALTDGQPIGAELGYVALPAELIARSRASVDAVR
ncbi:MAG: phosphate ABC transporter substrate-binding protein PstS [Burkholderiales bacterium]